MRLRPPLSLDAVMVASGSLSTGALATPAMFDGMVGYYTPDGDRMMPDGSGGYYSEYGHINTNDANY